MRTLRPEAPPDGGVSPQRAEIAHDVQDLYEVYFEEVARWVRYLGVLSAEVDDAIQEVFLIAYEGVGRRGPDVPIAGWLFRITQNVVRHQRRGQRWRELLRGVPIDSVPNLPGGDSRDDVESQEARRLLQRALEALPERYRVPLILFELDGRSAEEIAGLLDIRITAVWTRLSRGREKLLSKFEALERRKPAPLGRRHA